MSWPVDLLTLQLAATEDGRTPPPPIQAIQRSRGRVQFRSEEGRVGEEGRFRWAPDHLKKKKVAWIAAVLHLLEGMHEALADHRLFVFRVLQVVGVNCRHRTLLFAYERVCFLMYCALRGLV